MYRWGDLQWLERQCLLSPVALHGVERQCGGGWSSKLGPAHVACKVLCLGQSGPTGPGVQRGAQVKRKCKGMLECVRANPRGGGWKVRRK